MTKKDNKYFKSKKNVVKDLPTNNSFHDIDSGPKISTLRLRVIQKKETDEKFKYFKNIFDSIYFRRWWGLGHNDLLIDPYAGTIKFTPSHARAKRERFFEEFDKYFKDGNSNNKVGLTLCWYAGSFPISIFRPRRIYSENFIIVDSEWSGVKTIVLRDWIKETPKPSYWFYTFLALVVITVPSILTPLLLISGG